MLHVRHLDWHQYVTAKLSLYGFESLPRLLLSTVERNPKVAIEEEGEERVPSENVPLAKPSSHLLLRPAGFLFPITARLSRDNPAIFGANLLWECSALKSKEALQSLCYYERYDLEITRILGSLGSCLGQDRELR